METHTTEEQQLEALKNWWKENGSSVVTGVMLGLAVLFGGKAWFAYQERTAENASTIYTVMMTALENGDTALVNDRAALLIADFSSTPYAAFGALALAKLRLEGGELEAAQAQLQWVLDSSDSDIIRDTARLRLARVLLAANDLDGAEALLAQAGSGTAFDALFEEVRGDIHAARGDREQAGMAYQQALAGLADDSPGRQLLQLKYDSNAVDQATAPGEAAQ